MVGPITFLMLTVILRQTPVPEYGDMKLVLQVLISRQCEMSLGMNPYLVWLETSRGIKSLVQMRKLMVMGSKFSTAASPKKIEVLMGKKIGQKTVKDCDLTKGSWVFDESYPLYTKDSCPFIDEVFDSLGNGRLGSHYLKGRWQPKDCDLPRFNATKMLELIRGKRLVFVGDSINRNQWESLLCMLMGAIRDPISVRDPWAKDYQREGKLQFKVSGLPMNS